MLKVRHASFGGCILHSISPYAYTMPSINSICITLGVVLMVGSVCLGPPVALGIHTSGRIGVERSMNALLQEGTLVVDRDVLQAKHPEALENASGRAGDAATELVVLAVTDDLRRPSGLVMWGLLFMGVTWLVAGILIPAKTPMVRWWRLDHAAGPR